MVALLTLELRRCHDNLGITLLNQFEWRLSDSGIDDRYREPLKVGRNHRGTSPTLNQGRLDLPWAMAQRLHVPLNILR